MDFEPFVDVLAPAVASLAVTVLSIVASVILSKLPPVIRASAEAKWRAAEALHREALTVALERDIRAQLDADKTNNQVLAHARAYAQANVPDAWRVLQPSDAFIGNIIDQVRIRMGKGLPL